MTAHVATARKEALSEEAKTFNIRIPRDKILKATLFAAEALIRQQTSSLHVTQGAFIGAPLIIRRLQLNFVAPITAVRE